MNNQKIVSIGVIMKPLLIFFVLLVMCASVFAQDRTFRSPSPQPLTRGKMWQTSYEFTLEGMTNFAGSLQYPGYYNRGSQNGGADGFTNNRTWVYYMGCREGGECLMQRQRRYGMDRTFLVYGPHEVVKNYDFLNDPNMPEEYKTGYATTPDLVPTDGGAHNLVLDLESFKAVWGHPKYDDFVISKTTITNADEVNLTDVRFGWYLNMVPSIGGYSKGFRNDTEYIWDDTLPMAIDTDPGAFVFYDDTSIPQFTTDPIVYNIEPGVTYGDRGDPGNIKVAGSIDSRLYSPQVVCYAIVDMTPNKYGQKRAEYNIISAQNATLDWSYKAGGVPQEEFFRYDTGADYGFYNEHMGYIGAKGNEQIRRDWKDLNANPDASKPTDGSIWERSPTLFVTGGPWDLAPGESAEVWTFLIGGDMDRTISMKGGLNAVAQLPDASIADLRKNFQSAWELYSAAKANGFTNWNEAITEYPPPTPGTTPEAGVGTELIVETFSEVVGGKPSQGYIVKWIPVPDDYVDPIKGVNDFKEYIVYQSVIGLLGPWEEIVRYSKEQAAGMMQDGRVVARIEAESGIPSRWCVTTIDTDGNESAMKAFSYFAQTAARAPVDDVSQVTVIPNPFRQISGFLDPGEEKRLTFINIPAKCTIRIYTVAGDLVKEIEHEGFGEVAWGSSINNNYMLTDFGHNVMPGIYIYHIESHVEGYEGESHIGKFAIIK